MKIWHFYFWRGNRKTPCEVQDPKLIKDDKKMTEKEKEKKIKNHIFSWCEDELKNKVISIPIDMDYESAAVGSRC